MLERSSGNQINIVSLNNYAPLKHVLPYAVSKAGLGHMTRALALEWGPRGVRVNAIAPGFILTDLTKALWARPDMQAWGMPNTPLRRLGVRRARRPGRRGPVPGFARLSLRDRANPVRRWRVFGRTGLADRSGITRRRVSSLFFDASLPFV
jgi:NAD(P)-dependent dehydrogenase (short-subunit alcohol dehydrogenase family)